MSGTAASVVRMANQIVLNFAHLSVDDAARATADHIAHFWDPRMRAIADGLVSEGAFSPVAERALRSLRTGEPSPQTRATEFNHDDEGGGSDAG